MADESPRAMINDPHKPVVDQRRLLLSPAVMHSSTHNCEPSRSSGQCGSPAAGLRFIWARARVTLWRRRFAIGAVGVSALVLGAALTFANWYMGQDERLGVVNFPTSCEWQSQREFTTATALLHLFQFADAEEVYTSVIQREPACAIAYWGIAMSRL